MKYVCVKRGECYRLMNAQGSILGLYSSEEMCQIAAEALEHESIEYAERWSKKDRREYFRGGRRCSDTA